MKALRVGQYAALLSLALVAATPSAAAASTRKAAEESLTCQCGCGLTVHTCNHLQCSFAVPVREDIAKSLAAGQTTEEILDRYVQEYGEKVLSAPTTSGFNILAWWGPYIALGFGCGALLLAFRRWRHVADEEPLATSTAAAPKSLNSQDRDRLARELEDLDA